MRIDYATDVMRNGCHASDAPDSLIRECKIIGLSGDEVAPELAVIDAYLKEVGER